MVWGKSITKVYQLFLLTITLACLYGFTDPALRSIEVALMQKDYKSVEKIATDELSKNYNQSTKNQIRYYLALSYLHSKKFPKARSIFNDLKQSKISISLRDRVYLGLCDAYFMDGKYNDAILIANRLHKISPRSDYLSLIYYKMARANLKLAQWTTAKSYLNRIINEFPNSLEQHFARQLLLEEQYFAVQVGSFLQRANAEELSEELQRKGEYAYVVVAVDQQNRKLFRVRVGQVAHLSEAQRLEAKLSKLGYPTRIFP